MLAESRMKPLLHLLAYNPLSSPQPCHKHTEESQECHCLKRSLIAGLLAEKPKAHRGDEHA